MELLRGRAFADVSVDEIAARAGVARRTVFRYFPTKEDILVDRRRIDRAYARAALAAPAADEDEIALVLRVLTEIRRRTFALFSNEQKVLVHRLTHDDAALAGRTWLFMQDVGELVVDELLRGRKDGADVMRARVLVMSCVMVVDAAITRWFEDGMRKPMQGYLDAGAAHLRSGFAGSDRPPAVSRGKRGARTR